MFSFFQPLRVSIKCIYISKAITRRVLRDTKAIERSIVGRNTSRRREKLTMVFARTQHFGNCFGYSARWYSIMANIKSMTTEEVSR
jgi:hypothetical protein